MHIAKVDALAYIVRTTMAANRDSKRKTVRIRGRKRASMKRTLITGLVIGLPVVVTFWVIRFGLNQIDRIITPTVERIIELTGWGAILDRTWVPYITPVASVVVLLIVVYMLGLVGGNVIGRQVLGGLDSLLRTIPVVRGIYSSTRQFLDTFSGDSRAFSKVVLVEYPRKDLWTLGLLTGNTQGEVPERTAKSLVSVFIPTTPNPTSGWLLFVPQNDVIELSMTVDDAFKMIISGGVLTPEFKGPKLAATNIRSS